MFYTKGIIRGCCNNVFSSFNNTGDKVTCDLYAFFDVDVSLGYELTKFSISIFPVINLTNLATAQAALKTKLELSGYMVASVTMEDLNDGLLISVLGTDLSSGDAQISGITFAEIVDEEILSSCSDNWEARDDNDFELREGGGFEIRE